MIHNGWPETAPKGFLNTNDLKTKEVLAMRTVGTIENCARCNDSEVADELGSKLTHFACTPCRNDEQEWNFGGDSTIDAMCWLSPLPDVRTE